ncbi:hypothetical protein HDU96_008464 [Phlyctochytrium bullatum]|nr:hypothetical protein HDU96_008464 [Phlyctochytrium bullatum]
MDERIPIFADTAREEYFAGPNLKPDHDDWNSRVDSKYHPLWLYSVATGRLEYTFIGPRQRKRYLAICHLWRHNNFPELHGGDLDAMTEEDWETFREKVRRIIASVPEVLELKEPIEHVWLDQVSVDQKDRESCTVLCLPGVEAEKEMEQCRTSLWVMQELFISRESSAFLLNGQSTKRVKIYMRKIRRESELWESAAYELLNNGLHRDQKTLFRRMLQRHGGWPLDKIYAIRQALRVERITNLPCTYDRTIDDVIWMLNEDDDSALRTHRLLWEYGLSHGPLYPLINHACVGHGLEPYKEIHPTHGVKITSRSLSPWSAEHLMGKNVGSTWKEGDEFVLCAAPFILGSCDWFERGLDFANVVGYHCSDYTADEALSRLLAEIYTPESHPHSEQEKIVAPETPWSGFIQRVFWFFAPKATDSDGSAPEASDPSWRRGFGDGPPAYYNFRTSDKDTEKGMQLAMKAMRDRWEEIESCYPPVESDDDNPWMIFNASMTRMRDIISLHLKTHPDIQRIDWDRTVAIFVKESWKSPCCWLLDATPNVSCRSWKVSSARLADSKIAAWFYKFGKLFEGLIEPSFCLAAEPDLQIPGLDVDDRSEVEGEEQEEEEEEEAVGSEERNEEGGGPFLWTAWSMMLASVPKFLQSTRSAPREEAETDESPPQPHSCGRNPRNGFCCGMDSKIATVAATARDEYFAGDALNKPQFVDRRYQPIWLYCLETGEFEYTFVGPRLRKGYLALSHLWKHNIFPELRRGLIDTMTEADWTTFYSKVKSICAEISALSGLESSEIGYIWLDEACVDQSDKEAIRSATYIMSYVYEWAKATVVCLPGLNPEEEMQQWLSSTWTMQELLYSRHILVHFSALGLGSSTGSSERANADAKRFRGMHEKDVAGLVAEMHSRKGGWPLDKVYAIRHIFKGLNDLPVTYDRDIKDVLLLLDQNHPSDFVPLLYYFWLSKADSPNADFNVFDVNDGYWDDEQEWKLYSRVHTYTNMISSFESDQHSIHLWPSENYQAEKVNGFEAAMQAVLARWSTIESQYPRADGPDDDEKERFRDIMTISLQSHPNLQSVDWSRTVALEYYDDVFLADATPDFERGCWEVTGGRLAESAVAEVLKAYKPFLNGYVLDRHVSLSAEHQGVNIFPDIGRDWELAHPPKSNEK